MPKTLFNTPFENALRILLLLDAFIYPQTLDKLYTVDFLTIYGKSFGITESNLNGDNQYKFSEFASRREAVKNALKELVIEGLAQVLNLDNGIAYTISADGEEYCTTLESEYAADYRQNAKRVINRVDGQNERDIITFITKMSAKSLIKEEQ